MYIYIRDRRNKYGNNAYIYMWQYITYMYKSMYTIYVHTITKKCI